MVSSSSAEVVARKVSFITSRTAFFVLVADTDALFHQELFRKRLLGDEADNLFLALIIQADRCSVDREGQVAALEQTRYQPMHIVFHKNRKEPS